MLPTKDADAEGRAGSASDLPLECHTEPHSPGLKASTESGMHKSNSSMSLKLKQIQKKAKRKVYDVTSAYSTQMKTDWRWILCYILLGGFTYTACFLYVGDVLLPYAPAFAVTILFISAHVLGWLAGLVKLPPLLGMLLAGVLLRNLPGDPVQGLPESWSATIRVAGLSIIFLRSGLELDWRAFKKVGWVALRLTCFPGISEAVVVGLAAMGLFQMNIFMGLTLGFILAAVSPAVVVNGMFALQKAGYGVAKGIPSLVVAAASFDDVVAITGYSLFIGLAVPSGSLTMSIVHGPLNLILGTAGGIVGGLVLSASTIWTTRLQRTSACFILGQLLMAFFVYFHFKGAGALASLVMGITAMIAWEQGFPKILSKGPNNHYAHETEADLAGIWRAVGQPMLFSVIGTALDFRTVTGSTIPLAIGIVIIGVVVRLPVAGAVLWGANLSVKERVFIALSWIPKATVQAALASAPLDVIYRQMMQDPAWMGECANPDSQFRGNQSFEEFCIYEDWGQDIVTTAVFSIIITAPIGLLIFENLGPKWLTQDRKPAQDGESESEMASSAVSDTVVTSESAAQPNGRAGMTHRLSRASMGVRFESKLEVMDARLSFLMESAEALEAHPDKVPAFKADLRNTLLEVRKQMMEMEFANTPATQETAGQFFRVTGMEKYLEEENGGSASSTSCVSVNEHGETGALAARSSSELVNNV